MTEDGMALVELLQKSGDSGFLRAVAEAVLQIPMEADVEGLISAGRNERSRTSTNASMPSSIARSTANDPISGSTPLT
jgi:putative transposase